MIGATGDEVIRRSLRGDNQAPTQAVRKKVALVLR
jgi:hypothetical protein